MHTLRISHKEQQKTPATTTITGTTTTMKKMNLVMTTRMNSSKKSAATTSEEAGEEAEAEEGAEDEADMHRIEAIEMTALMKEKNILIEDVEIETTTIEVAIITNKMKLANITCLVEVEEDILSM